LGILLRLVHGVNRENRSHVEIAFGHASACASNSEQ
jgi:hypothetical protein